MKRFARALLCPWLATVCGVLASPAAKEAGAQGGLQYVTPTWVGAPDEDYVRLLQLTGAMAPSSWLMRPASPGRLRSSQTTAHNPWLGSLRLPDTSRHGHWSLFVFDPNAQLVFNSRLPALENHGALWAGRGVSGVVEGGVEMRLGPAHLTVAPSAVYSQNRAFPLVPLGADVLARGYTPYANANFFESADLPQRFGASAIYRLDAGQSELRVDGLGLSLGISTANQWWGPGTFNSLLMTNGAPGFRHAFLGTSRPLDIWLGKLESRWVVGRMDGSGFTTTQPDSLADRRWLNGFGLFIAPRFAPTLYVGAIRVFYKYLPPGGIHTHDLLDVFQALDKAGLPPSEQFADAADQMLSVMARWVLPSSGLEFYGEWGRNDHSWDTRDLILDLTHASAAVIGMQKVFVRETGFYRLGLEAIDLPTPPADGRRDVPIFYTHPQIVEGYTQRGRLIGASVGPIGSGQYLSLDAFRSWGRIGGRLALIQHPINRFGPSDAVPTRLASTLSARKIAGPLSWDAAITYERLLNDAYRARTDLSNLTLQLGASWQPGPTRGLTKD